MAGCPDTPQDDVRIAIQRSHVLLSDTAQLFDALDARSNFEPIINRCASQQARRQLRMVLIESEPRLYLFFDVFSSREPRSSSLENAIALRSFDKWPTGLLKRIADIR
ncbi:MAG: hypothetical protein ACXWKP_01215 [Bradyrhizobium sp.]